MKRTLSQMTYAPFQAGQAGQGGPTVLTLHGYNQFAESMRGVVLAVNPTGRVVGLQSSKGVYIGRTIVGYTWFLGPNLRLSPVHYGDSLADLERFLWDEVDRQEPASAGLPFLVGDEQGAIMALSMSGVAPDLLSGIVAINAVLPQVPGWEPPLAPLNGLPVLLVNPIGGGEDEPRVLAGDALVRQLKWWGGSVSVVVVAGGGIPTDQIAEWIAQQPLRTLQPTTA
jgi:predicted esterase